MQILPSWGTSLDGRTIPPIKSETPDPARQQSLERVRQAARRVDFTDAYHGPTHGLSWQESALLGTADIGAEIVGSDPIFHIRS